MKRLILTALLLIVSAVAAQDFRQFISVETYLEIQEAAAFTDGFTIECPAPSGDNFTLCVNTSSTGWTAAQLRNWSDYGLSAWRVFENWRLDGDIWSLYLLHPGRGELMGINVNRSGTRVVYVAGRY